MKKTTTFLLMAAALFAAAPLQSAEVSADQARIAARNWLRRNPKPLQAKYASANVTTVRSVAGDDGKSLFHVADVGDGGFVVTSGDTELTPIIAFSDSGSFVMSEDSPLYALLWRDLSCRRAALAASKAGGRSSQKFATGDGAEESVLSENEAEWAELLNAKAGAKFRVDESTGISDVCVAPLVKSKWTQGSWNGQKTFNYYTPGGYVCGCVATAFGQIMRLWQYPASSVAASFECAVSESFDYEYDDVKTTLTTRGGTYNWSSMPLTRDACTTDVQREAIGHLIYDFSVSTGTWFTRGASSSSTWDGYLSLRRTFGYASVNFYQPWWGEQDEDYVSEHALKGKNIAAHEDYRNAILGSLDAGMPVVIGVYAHAMVVDGYGYNGSSAVYCHINCGWDGLDDASTTSWARR